jgi:transcriptional regulator with XRE-family HTH domain
MKNYQDNFGEQLGEAVKTLRERFNLSQEDLREKAGFSTGYLSRLEAGKYTSPSISHIFQLAQAFGMNLRDFLEYAKLIPAQSTFEACLRGEGHSEDEIKKILEIKNYVLFSNKSSSDATTIL